MVRKASANRFKLATGKTVEEVTIEISHIAGRVYMSILGEKLIKHYVMTDEAWDRLTGAGRP
jgi:hypothetical protein